MDHDAEVVAFCAKAYMAHIRNMVAAVADIEGEVAEHEQSLALMGVDYSRGGGGAPTADKLPDGVARLLDLRDRLAHEHARCTNDIAYARQVCRGNEDMRALWMHEVERMPYGEIARALGCSAMTARRRVASGERMMYALMPEEWRRYAIPNAMPE